MNEKTVVKTDEIRQIANNINSKREEINGVFKTDVLPVLNSSEDCLKVSGLNYDEVINAFNNLFNSLDGQLNNLTDVLINKVIPSYENVSEVIKKYFNADFAEQMSKAIATMNGTQI